MFQIYLSSSPHRCRSNSRITTRETLLIWNHCCTHNIKELELYKKLVILIEGIDHRKKAVVRILIV